jgi:hypothetical protein
MKRRHVRVVAPATDSERVEMHCLNPGVARSLHVEPNAISHVDRIRRMNSEGAKRHLEDTVIGLLDAHDIGHDDCIDLGSRAGADLTDGEIAKLCLEDVVGVRDKRHVQPGSSQSSQRLHGHRDWTCPCTRAGDEHGSKGLDRSRDLVVCDTNSGGVSRPVPINYLFQRGRFVRGAHRVIVGSVDPGRLGLEADAGQGFLYSVVRREEEKASHIEQDSALCRHVVDSLILLGNCPSAWRVFTTFWAVGQEVRVANLPALALLEISHAVANAESDCHVDEGGNDGCLHQEDQDRQGHVAKRTPAEHVSGAA